jgi:hypothetical protein
VFDYGLLGPAEMVVTENLVKNLLVGQGNFAMRLSRADKAKRRRVGLKRTDALSPYCPAFCVSTKTGFAKGIQASRCAQ